MLTHYEILGVEPTATRKQIKRAWRKCVKKTHPDKNPDDPTAEARFKEVQAAWEVLADAESRKRYDESLRAPPPPPPPPPRPEPPVHRCADCQTPIAADRSVPDDERTAGFYLRARRCQTPRAATA